MLPSRRFENIFGDMDRYLDSFWGLPSMNFEELRTPLIDIENKEKEIIVSVEIPGINKEEIDLEVNENNLIVKAERKSKKEQKDKNYYRCERSYSSFYRNIPLPEAIQENNTTAEYKDGILKVTLPKKESRTNNKKIEIK